MRAYPRALHDWSPRWLPGSWRIPRNHPRLRVVRRVLRPGSGDNVAPGQGVRQPPATVHVASRRRSRTGTRIRPDLLNHHPQWLPALVKNAAIIQIVIGVGHSIDAPPNVELVQMIIFPSHYDLQDAVELRQSCVVPDLKATPDGWMNIVQCHLELIQDSVLRFRHRALTSVKAAILQPGQVTHALASFAR